MLFASGSLAGDMFIWCLIVVGFYTWAAKKYLANNPDVKNAAQKAAANKIKSILLNLFK